MNSKAVTTQHERFAICAGLITDLVVAPDTDEALFDREWYAIWT